MNTRSIGLTAFLVLAFVLAAPSAAADDGDARPWEAFDAFARSFIDHVTSGRTADAYRMLGDDVQKELPLEAFARMLAAYRGPMGELRTLEPQGREPRRSGCGRLAYDAAFELAALTMKLDICEEEGGLRVSWFDTKAKSVSLEAIVRKTLVESLEGKAPEIRRIECPGLDEAEGGASVQCLVDFGGGCTFTLDVQRKANGGFQIVGASKTDVCDPLFAAQRE